jgi:hypothetical protein
MIWRPAVLVVASVIAVQASAGCGQQAAATTCPAGHSPYQAADVALRLGADDSGRSYRLPLGEIVTAGSGFCVSGDALEVLGPQSEPASPGPIDAQAYRAVRTGQADIHQIIVCSEACFAAFVAKITVTNGCELLSRENAINKVRTRHPISIPQGETVPPPPATKVKLIKASQYEQIFGEPLYLPADTKVWAVLTGTPIVQSPSPSGPSSVLWLVTAVDACTDWMSSPWEATSTPPGWTAVPDLSTTVM